MLEPCKQQGRIEAGCDEAGRGPLAGPVMAAAVILTAGYVNPQLNDSKQLNERQRNLLRDTIEQEASCWAVAQVSAADIDRLNILHASTHAMCLAIQALTGSTDGIVAAGGKALGTIQIDHLLIDGNRFYNETPYAYDCIVGGDAKYMSIAAASILAKTYRDAHMTLLHTQYPQFGWDHNKGYPTAAHYKAIEQHGITPHHRRTFTLYRQHTLFE